MFTTLLVGRRTFDDTVWELSCEWFRVFPWILCARRECLNGDAQSNGYCTLVQSQRWAKVRKWRRMNVSTPSASPSCWGETTGVAPNGVYTHKVWFYVWWGYSEWTVKRGPWGYQRVMMVYLNSSGLLYVVFFLYFTNWFVSCPQVCTMT